MFKKITFIIVLLIIAKPTYDFIVEQIDENQVEVIEPVNMTSTKIDESEQIGDGELPTKITSEQQLADAFYYYFSRFTTNFTIQYVGSTKNMDELLERATSEASKRNPFIDGHFSERNITYTYNKLSAKIDVSQTYLITYEQALQVEATVEQLIATQAAHLTSDYDKVKFVNDYIVQNTVYSEQTLASPHSAYTALAERKAVCQGYALLAQMMLTKLGVDAYYVVGEAGGIGHAWNLVNVNGAWYHLDTTWNDPLPDRGREVQYTYFLVSDQQLGKDHTWERANYPQAINENL